MSSRRRNQNPRRELPDLVAELRHSNLPNLVVEGDDDVIIYGKLVDDYLDGHIGICQTGGRETLLRLYETLSHAEKQGDFTHTPVAFIADRDMWIFRGIPPRYTDIIWTIGYSIENDLYSSANLRSLVSIREYEEVLTSISRWFAQKVEEYLCKNPPTKPFNDIRDEQPADGIDIHCNQIVPLGETGLAEGLVGLPTGHNRVQQVRQNYNLQLRGKHLFELLVRFLSDPRNPFPSARINHHALYNQAITSSKANDLFSQLKTNVQDKLQKQREKTQHRPLPLNNH